METKDLLVIIVEYVRNHGMIPYKLLKIARSEAFLYFTVCEYTSTLYASRSFRFNIINWHRILPSRLMCNTTYMKNDCVHFLKATWSGCEFHQHN